MSGLVHEHGRLEPYFLLNPEPMEADECVGDVVGVTQGVDKLCCRVHHRLNPPEQVGRKTRPLMGVALRRVARPH